MSTYAQKRFAQAQAARPDLGALALIKTLRGLSPYDRGVLARLHVMTLAGMPYGPGPRQDAYIQGFRGS